MILLVDGDERERGRCGEQSQCASIDYAIKIDGCLDEYLPGMVSAEYSRDISLTANMIGQHLKVPYD